MLEIKQIDVYYGDIQILWSVSLRVDEKEIVAVLGSNGAGKSTILKTLAGLLRPVTGSIFFKGVDLSVLPADKRVKLGITLVPEGRGLFAGMTVLENLELGAYHPLARIWKAQNLEFVYKLFPILAQRQEQIAGSLSGGEGQMVAIGRGLMANPELLLLDEPSLGLAPLTTRSIFGAVEQVNKANVTIALVEQNVKTSLELANRAYIIENGHIVGHGRAQDLLRDPTVKAAYLGL